MTFDELIQNLNVLKENAHDNTAMLISEAIWTLDKQKSLLNTRKSPPVCDGQEQQKLNLLDRMVEFMEYQMGWGKFGESTHPIVDDLLTEYRQLTGKE